MTLNPDPLHVLPDDPDPEPRDHRWVLVLLAAVLLATLALLHERGYLG